MLWFLPFSRRVSAEGKARSAEAGKARSGDTTAISLRPVLTVCSEAVHGFPCDAVLARLAAALCDTHFWRQ